MKTEFISDIRNYINNLRVNSDELHILSSTELEQYFKHKLFKDKKMNIILFKELDEILYPTWNNTIEIIRMDAIIRDIIEKLDLSEHERKSYLKEINKISSVIRYLSQSGIRNFNTVEADKDLSITKRQKDYFKIFNEFIDDIKVKDALEELAKPIDRSIVAQKVSYFNKKNKGIGGELIRISRIYIYNNIKLDMKSYLTLKKLEARGIEVVFRCYFTAQIALNCPKYYAYIKSVSDCKEPVNRIFKSNFMKYLNGQDIVKNFNEDLAFINFENPSKFKQFLREHPLEKEHTYDGTINRHYVAISSDIYNDYFKDVVLDSDIKCKDIYSYAEGNFILSLYNVVPEENNFRISFNDLLKCITSGWIEIKSGAKYISGRRAETLLMDLQDYFRGCITINDYEERIQTLEMLMKFKDEFDALSSSKVLKDNVKKYLMNPLTVFSYLNSDRYEVTIKQLGDLVHKFKRICDTLLPDEVLDVNKHLDELRNLWNSLSFNCDENDRDMNNVLFEDISSSLEFRGEEYELMSFNEMRSLLVALTSKKMSEDGTIIKIKSISAIEGIILEDVKEVNIIDLTEKSIERIYKLSNLCPITDINYLSKILTYSNRNNAFYKEIFKIHKKWTESFDDYLNYNLCMLFENYEGRINLFYIDGILDNDNKSSVYNIIKNIYEVDESISDTSAISYFDFMDEHKKVERLTSKDVHFADDLSPTAFLDLDFCSRKFYYSNILESNPVYSQDMHQQMAFTSLASLFSGGSKNDERVKDIFFSLFPQWTDTLKENLLETSCSRDINKRYKFKNINFPYYAKEIQILRSRYGLYHKVRDAYNHKNMKNDEYIKSFLEDTYADSVKARPGSHCSMCPYKYICTKGEWAVDRNDY